jgi:hypothetical protein
VRSDRAIDLVLVGCFSRLEGPLVKHDLMVSATRRYRPQAACLRGDSHVEGEQPVMSETCLDRRIPAACPAKQSAHQQLLARIEAMDPDEARPSTDAKGNGAENVFYFSGGRATL